MRSSWIGFLSLSLISCGGYPDEIRLDDDGLVEPDRVLFERAQFDLEKSRYTQAQLLFQNLIQTYEDSEYTPLAMYGTAESFYHMGTRADLAQAKAEYQDFIIFFPTDDLADDARLMIAMTHIRQIQKPDRDNTHAALAEVELTAFLEEYPDSPLLDEAKGFLRAVQDVLADGIFRVANFYMAAGQYPAAEDRYLEILERYPDFGQTPDTLYRLGEIMQQNENEGESILYWGRVLREYPFSPAAELARVKLTELDQPIPDPNPAALALAEEEVEPEFVSLGARMFGLFRGRPDIPLDTGARSIKAGDGEGGGGEVEPTLELEGVILEEAGPPGQ